MHVATMNHWRDIASQILDRISKAGLLEATIHLHIGVVGHGDGSILAAPRILISQERHELREFEFPTLRMLWRHCLETDCLVYYLHTKGVSHRPNPKSDRWRAYMLSLVVDRWRGCVKALAENDACGGIYRHRRRYFAGNFWWASSAHIRTLKEPKYVRSRGEAESWLLNTPNPVRLKILH